MRVSAWKLMVVLIAALVVGGVLITVKIIRILGIHKYTNISTENPILSEHYAYQAFYNYTIADFDRCERESPDVLIWVQGRATSPYLRSMIRNTFGDQQNWPHNMSVLLIFFTGKLQGKKLKYQPVLEYEFELYRDIVQADFLEGYKNQVSKMVSAINYISDHCNSSKLIFRIDDDVIFHPHFMLNKLIDIMLDNSSITIPSNSGKSSNISQMFPSEFSLQSLPNNTIACHLISDFGVWRTKDHPKHFNAVDDSVLPGEDWYPPFCAGFFVAMTGDVPQLLRPHIATNTLFWMDDRYMGVLQKRASTNNINISPILDFGYESITIDVLALLVNGEKIARHLPGKQKLHITQLHQYLDLASVGLRGHFEPILFK